MLSATFEQSCMNSAASTNGNLLRASSKFLWDRSGQLQIVNGVSGKTRSWTFFKKRKLGCSMKCFRLNWIGFLFDLFHLQPQLRTLGTKWHTSTMRQWNMHPMFVNSSFLSKSKSSWQDCDHVATAILAKMPKRIVPLKCVWQSEGWVCVATTFVHCAESCRPFELFANENCKL